MKKIKGWGFGLLVVVVAIFGFMWNKTRNAEQLAVSQVENRALEEIGNGLRQPLQDFFYANRRLARAGDRVKGFKGLPAYVKDWRLLENGVVEVDINPGWGIARRKVTLVPIVGKNRYFTYLPAGKLSPDMRAAYGNIEFLSDADIERQLALNQEQIKDAFGGTETATQGKVWFVAGAGNVCAGDCVRDLPCVNARPLMCQSKSTRELKSTNADYRGTDFDQLTDADAICAGQFGPGWAVAQTGGHMGGPGYTELMPQREYWVHDTKSTFGNCWGTAS